MKQRGNAKTGVIVGAVVVVIVIVVGLLLWHGHKHSGGTGKTHRSKEAIAVIEITPSGFLPSTLAVQADTDVTWVNEDVMPHLPAADPYPTHASLRDLVAPKALGQKETYSFLFTRHETVHYHDDLNPTLVGTVEVR